MGGSTSARLGQQVGAAREPSILQPPNSIRRISEIVGAKLLGPYTISLDGQQRFGLAQGSQAGRLDGPPTSTWMAIERDEDLYREVDAMIYAAFDKHLVIQTFEPPNLTPALAPTGLPDELRQSTTAEAIAAQQAAKPLVQMSDGVQVFCGMISAIAALPHLLLLIDEPEAFLHPTLSRLLGSNLARIARERGARLIVATHSADFLMGCLDESPQTTVLRLDYREDIATSHEMSAHQVGELSRDPLLRSANSLQALFTRSAVVCEADSDRAFYSEINRRLRQAQGRTGASDVAFLNAQNWQTTVRLASPLRAAGVPAAVILDFDTLTVDQPWAALLRMAGLSNEDRNRVAAARSAGRDAVNDIGRAADNDDAPLRVKIEGLSACDQNQRATLQIAFDELANIGIS